jgi:hypothetical protein
LGYEKPQSAYGLCAVFLRRIFAVAGMLRIPLSQPQNRHIQPERKKLCGIKKMKSKRITKRCYQR